MYCLRAAAQEGGACIDNAGAAGDPGGRRAVDAVHISFRTFGNSKLTTCDTPSTSITREAISGGDEHAVRTNWTKGGPFSRQFDETGLVCLSR